MSKLFLGVDGGQSGTTALIADETGEILGRGSSGPCNHASGEEAKAKLRRVVADCVRLARESAGVPVDRVFEAACFGMSGGPADKISIIRDAIPALQWKITNDGVTALSGAHVGEPGVIVIAGTGSLAMAKGPRGEIRRAGGWGYVFGDEGGAFDIVRQALRACLRAEEGWGEPTGLQDLLLVSTGAENINAVLHHFYTQEWPRSRVATLASEIDRLAEAGDTTAQKILDHAGQSLALFAQSAALHLWRDGEAASCSYVGGVFRSARVLQRFRSLLELSGVKVVTPVLGPACGALLEAFRLVNLMPDRSKLLSSKFRHD